MCKKKTLADYFTEHASEEKFVYELETGKKKTHTSILNHARKISSFKQINKNDVVTVILPNSIEYI